MLRCAIINTDLRKIINVVEYAAVPVGAPPGFRGPFIAVAHDRVDDTWTWDGAQLIAPVLPAVVATAAMVKAEAQRRIIALTGKTSLQDCMIKQSNALMRAAQLTDKRVNGATLTAEEETEAAALRGFADQIQAIRDASDGIERLEPIPAAYGDDKFWPR